MLAKFCRLSQTSAGNCNYYDTYFSNLACGEIATWSLRGMKGMISKVERWVSERWVRVASHGRPMGINPITALAYRVSGKVALG